MRMFTLNDDRRAIACYIGNEFGKYVYDPADGFAAIMIVIGGPAIIQLKNNL